MKFSTLLILIVCIALVLGISLTPGKAASPPQALQQEDTPYPPVDTPNTTPPAAYPGQETPTLEFTATITLRPGEPTYTPAPSQTIGASPTLRPSPTKGRDLFATEDTEIKNARGTPPASETPSPSRTAFPRSSPNPTGTPTKTPFFIFSETWFLAGLFIPALAVIVITIVLRMRSSGEFRG